MIWKHHTLQSYYKIILFCVTHPHMKEMHIQKEKSNFLTLTRLAFTFFLKKQMCSMLAANLDSIRAEYWTYIRRSINARHFETHSEC